MNQSKQSQVPSLKQLQNNETVLGWMQLLCNIEIPAFGKLFQTLKNSDVVDDKPIPKDIEKLLKSPEITTNVLNVSNNVIFSKSQTKIKNVDYAIILMGIKALRDIGVFSAFLESLLKEECSIELYQEVVHSYTASILACHLAQCQRKTINELDIFLATFLRKVGYMIFYKFGAEKAQQYLDALKQSQTSPIDQQNEIIGFKLDDLGVVFVNEFSLNREVFHALTYPLPPKSIYFVIELARQLVTCTKNGFKNENTVALIKDASEKLNTTPETLVEIIKCSFGIAEADLSYFEIPDLEMYFMVKEINTPEEVNSEELIDNDDIEIDSQLITLLTKRLARPNTSKNDKFQVALESMHQGLCLDRVMVALLDDGHKFLNGYLIKEEPMSCFKDKFQINLSEEQGFIFQKAYLESRGAWIGGRTHNDYNELYYKSLKQIIKAKEFLFYPVIERGHIIGFYYADRQFSRVKMKLSCYDLFVDACQTVNESLNR